MTPIPTRCISQKSARCIMCCVKLFQSWFFLFGEIQHCDKPLDPHSATQRGIMYAFVGWMANPVNYRKVHTLCDNCNALRHTATHCNTFVAKLQHFCSPSSNTTRYTHTHGYNGNVLQHTATGDGKHHLIMATYCNTLSQCVAVLQHTVAVCCSTLPL